MLLQLRVGVAEAVDAAVGERELLVHVRVGLRVRQEGVRVRRLPGLVVLDHRLLCLRCAAHRLSWLQVGIAGDRAIVWQSNNRLSGLQVGLPWELLVEEAPSLRVHCKSSGYCMAEYRGELPCAPEDPGQGMP